MPRRGENIRKRKDNRWEGRYIKSRSSTGKAIYGSVYGKTYSIVKEKLKSISTEEKEFSKGDNFTFREALLLWLDSNKIKQKIQTYNKYLQLIETQIIPELGDIKLSQLNYCICYIGAQSIFILGALIYLHNKSLICVSLLGSNFDKNKL